MSVRAARPCHVHTCAHLVRDNRPCPTHPRRAFGNARGNAAVYQDPAYRAASRELRQRFQPGDVCGICRQPMWSLQGLQVDHVVPVSRGGSNDARNVRLTHGGCNLARGAALGRAR